MTFIKIFVKIKSSYLNLNHFNKPSFVSHSVTSDGGEGKMSGENIRFLIRLDNGSWQMKIIPKGDAQNWIRGNPEAILIRYAVVSNAGNQPCETKEEAMQMAKEIGGNVRVIRPNERIFNQLPEEAIQLLYQS